MKTLNHRCAALTGSVGTSVGCSIYEDRPAACRAFTAGSPLCLEARAAAGLSILTPASSVSGLTA